MSVPYKITFGSVAAVVLLLAPAVVVLADHHEKNEKKQEKSATTQTVQPIDFVKLRNLMPDELAGLKRTNVAGERTAVIDFKLSQARATYGEQNNEKAPAITVDIADYGAVPDVESLAFWAGQEIDQQGDEGYTRTIKVKGHSALEQYNNPGRSGTLQVYVGKRYFVTVNTTNIPADEFKKLAEQLPVQKLAELKE